MAEPAPSTAPDYYARALALWPRLGHPHSARLRYDPRRVAAVISRRTNLPVAAILSLIGATEVDLPHSCGNHGGNH